MQLNARISLAMPLSDNLQRRYKKRRCDVYFCNAKFVLIHRHAEQEKRVGKVGVSNAGSLERD